MHSIESSGKTQLTKCRSEPVVSVILTTLNSEQFLARSVESCLNQTHRNLELLVVDGGSQDRTLEILAGYSDPRIRLIHQEDNVGKLPGALNLGMANAKGDFITWTQDDCWYEAKAIQTMVEYLDAHAKVAFVYTDFWEVDQAGDRIRYHVVEGPEHILEGDVLGVSFLFRREVYEAIGFQDTRYFPVHEVPWRVKASRHFRIQPLHIPLLRYTVHSRSLTGRIGGWNLARMVAKALFQEGDVGKREYRLRLAGIDIGQAYEEYVLRGDYGAFWAHVLPGIRRNAGCLRNWGLWKLMASSFLPFRKRYRDRLLSRWKEEMAAEQAKLIRKYAPEHPVLRETGFRGAQN